MASSRILHLILFFSSSSSAVFLLLLAPSASSTFISNNVLESHGLMGRSLLQQKTPCPVNFENLNYTIVTSQCKGPNYPSEGCCTGLKELSCPFAGDLNDDTNDCATTLFSYINLCGKYPPGLFASLCKENKEGIDCKKVNSEMAAQQAASDKKSRAIGKFTPSPFLILFSSFLVLVFSFFSKVDFYEAWRSHPLAYGGK